MCSEIVYTISAAEFSHKRAIPDHLANQRLCQSVTRNFVPDADALFVRRGSQSHVDVEQRIRQKSKDSLIPVRTRTFVTATFMESVGF